jgi:hypothetical protein
MGARTALVTARPFRAPPHTISDIGLIGGAPCPSNAASTVWGSTRSLNHTTRAGRSSRLTPARARLRRSETARITSSRPARRTWANSSGDIRAPIAHDFEQAAAAVRMHQAKVGHHDTAGQWDEVHLPLQPPSRWCLGPACREGLLQDAVVRLPRGIVRDQPAADLQGEASALGGGRHPLARH